MNTFKVVFPEHTDEYLKNRKYLTEREFVPGKIYNATTDGTDGNLYMYVFDENGHKALCSKTDFLKYDKEDDNPSTILDTGSRRSFSTGAVRDIDENKGRCDLMPLDVVSKFLNNDSVIEYLNDFKESTYKDTYFLELALSEFCQSAYTDDKTEMLLEVSMHFKQGAEKYGENNWQKGLPIYCYLDSAVRHYLKYLRGDKDERHDRAFVWNVMCMWWTVNKEMDVK